MNLSFTTALADAYTSSTQKARVLSEHWVSQEAYCPGCGVTPIGRYRNNNPAADFFCSQCGEDYELKSQRGRFGLRVVDGAFGTMMSRLKSGANPNLFLLSYEAPKLEVMNFVVIPKHFLTPQVIQQRKPLSAFARRAGWIGCNILLHRIPKAGQIYLVKNRNVESAATVIAKWRSTLFLREQEDLRSRGWLLDVIRCVERIGQPTFSLQQVYAFEHELQGLYPGNRHIRAKIRQQLQLLRDKHYLDFLGQGTYKLARSA